MYQHRCNHPEHLNPSRLFKCMCNSLKAMRDITVKHLELDSLLAGSNTKRNTI